MSVLLSLFSVILVILRDNRGELTLPDHPQEYVIGGVRYTVSVVYEAEDKHPAQSLRERFEHLVKCGAVDLHPTEDHDTITVEYVPAADRKGAYNAAE